MVNTGLHVEFPSTLGGKWIFTDSRPSHYLFLRLVLDNPPNTDAAFWRACHHITRKMQQRAATFRGRDASVLFPETRTYFSWGNQFLWEFWWNDGTEWNAEGLWNAINQDVSLDDLIKETMERYSK